MLSTTTENVFYQRLKIKEIELRGECGWLSSWIQAKHLKEKALATYCKTSTTHPTRLVVLRNFLLNDIALNLSRFLSRDAEFKQDYAVVGKYVSKGEWLKAAESRRIFRFAKIVEPRRRRGFNPEYRPYLDFVHALRSECFRRLFEGVSGLRLGPVSLAGPHSMRRGDFMGPHVDRGENRRLAFVIYLTSGWRKNFGGTLVVLDHSEKQYRVKAEYNSVACFDAGAGHYVTKIENAAGERARLTIGGWFLSTE